VRPQLEKLYLTSGRLVLDGYLMRGRIESWTRDLRRMKEDHWNVFLELVPHSIWAEMTPQLLERIATSCQVISSSMSTIERIVKVEPDLEMPADERARRAIEALDSTDVQGRCAMNFGMALGMQSSVSILT
jgi:hypothetical protein